MNGGAQCLVPGARCRGPGPRGQVPGAHHGPGELRSAGRPVAAGEPFPAPAAGV